MGEKQTKPFQLSFNGLLKVDFQGSHVTSDGGLILVRELDERLGLGELIDEHLSDSRQGTNKQFTLADLLRQSVYSRLAGYEDLNDAERVSIDPTFRLIGSQKIWDRGAALTSTLHGFETEMLASEENLLGLMALNRGLVGQAEAFDDAERVVLDLDSTESPVHGQQEGSAYNGHFESVCYHPLLLFNGHGDCLAAKLRPGNVHSAEDWDELLLPEIERQQAAGKQVAFRGDAAFAKPEVYEASEERGVQYAIRIYEVPPPAPDANARRQAVRCPEQSSRKAERSSASGLSDDHGRLHSAPFPAAKLASRGPSSAALSSRVPDPLKVVLGASYGVLVARRREVYPQACVIQGSYPREGRAGPARDRSTDSERAEEARRKLEAERERRDVYHRARYQGSHPVDERGAVATVAAERDGRGVPLSRHLGRELGPDAVVCQPNPEPHRDAGGRSSSRSKRRARPSSGSNKTRGA